MHVVYFLDGWRDIETYTDTYVYDMYTRTYIYIRYP